MYFILSYLPPLQILRLSFLNHRFRDLYVPVTMSTMTIGGTIPTSNSRKNVFALRIESSPNLLILQFPRSERDSSHQPRSYFWDSIKWNANQGFRKFKKSGEIAKMSRKPFAFNKVSWSTSVAIEWGANQFDTNEKGEKVEIKGK